MTTPTTAGGAVLPVVGYITRDCDFRLSALWNHDQHGALTLHAPAQAEIDALRAELQAMTDDRDSWCAQASARTEDAVRFAAERDSALTAYTIQKRERERLEGELTNCEARIREQRAEINRLAALKAALNPPAHTPPTGVFVQAAQDDQARPIRMERARGDTVAEMRKNLSPELWGHGDAVICWVNEGDYICADIAATKETP